MSDVSEIQVTIGGNVVDARRVSTPAGARRAMLAAIERHRHGTDTISQQAAILRASRWDGRTPLSVALTDYVRNNEVAVLIAAV